MSDIEARDRSQTGMPLLINEILQKQQEQAEVAEKARAFAARLGDIVNKANPQSEESSNRIIFSPRANPS